MDDPRAVPNRTRLLRRAAWITVALLVAVTLSSAFMRHRSGGLGCSPWPACYGQPMVEAAADVTVARVVHRLAASVVLVLVVVLALASWTAQPPLRREARVAGALVVLAGGLAVLGAFTPGSRTPAVAIGNLLGGFVMLALAVRWLDTRRALGGAAVAVALLLVLQIAAGGWVSGAYAATSCASWTECLAQSGASGWDRAPLDPWREAWPRGDGAILQLVHRVGAAVTVVAVLALAALAWRRARRGAAAALVSMVALQAVLGASIAGPGAPLALVMLHNAVAAALLALTVRLA
ncbi:MAG TPA: COX15/CtaA family protein [Burkholderiaceae bacterium]|nr:COX15/CtaA family protein [Burkholderiaceae bacterium]